jgi:hypothetical protein
VGLTYLQSSLLLLWFRIALLHVDRDTFIAGMVLDSPFADPTQLCEETVEKVVYF